MKFGQNYMVESDAPEDIYEMIFVIEDTFTHIPRIAIKLVRHTNQYLWAAFEIGKKSDLEPLPLSSINNIIIDFTAKLSLKILSKFFI